ncbi:hypothetical protein ID866_4175 [Astraeus odoratus]|nr:hypothetical protein ID866_4175 [Astraeus odoratus]
MREFFSRSRTPSRNPDTAEDAGEHAQVLQEVLQESALESVTSGRGLGQEESSKAGQRIDAVSPSVSYPGVAVSAIDGPNDQSSKGKVIATILTERPVGSVDNTDPSDTVEVIGEDVAISRPHNDGVPKDSDLKDLRSRMDNAQANVLLMKSISGADRVTGALDAVNSGLDQTDVITTYLQPLRVFDNVINRISEIHPYAKLALSTLSWAAQAILNQTNLDQSVVDLLSKIGHVYAFVMEDDTILKIDIIRVPLGELAKLVLKCVEFIETYAKAKSFWKRLKDNAFSDSSNMVATYNNSLDVWTQRCRDLILGRIYHGIGDVLAPVNRIQQIVGDTLDKIRNIESGVEHIQDETYLNKLAYANGAGLDASKTCLENTRMSTLLEIVNWVHSGDSSTQRVLWLHGQAGKGKSAIAHTIAKWFKDLGELGSCFCFAADQLADLRHKKIFATIARDLSDHYPNYRRVLSGAAADTSLVHAPDVKQHWQKFILEPFSQLPAAIGGPVVIVIDALDESGDEASRRSILDVLASVEPASLPQNIRILVTSRPLPDIIRKFGGSTHVKPKSMDEISSESATHDIQLYISSQLESSGYGLPEKAVTRLAEMSDGLFEWARLACEFIGFPKEAATPMERYEDLLSAMDGGGAGLLDGMYGTILKDMVGDSERTRSRFYSVMRQILWTLQPLSMDALNTMRRNFSREEDIYDVNLILRSMGALLSGTADRCTPVRPLHASFYDFLMDASRGGKFAVEVGDIHLDLAFASLKVMQDGLHFNICQLESSYLKNSQLKDLDLRIKNNIPSQLSYACQFWVDHVQQTKFDFQLGKEVEAFFEEKVLFWMEVLSLLKVLNTAAGSLAGIAQWMDGGFLKTAALARDAVKFLSSPLKGHTRDVTSVAFSPDGKRIASGSKDCTINLWDAEIGLQLGNPLQGHTHGVTSIAFSPDGKRIVSGSNDSTICLWDAETGSKLGSPLKGHTIYVTSVAFSPDGKQIASGSWDKTVCFWDAETGLQLGSALKGHTHWVTSVAFSPDGKRVASSSWDKTIYLWDVEVGLQPDTPFQGHTDDINSVAFSPDGKRIVSGSRDNSICLWDAETGLQLGSPLQGHADSVTSVAFSPNGKRIASGSVDNTICLWDAEIGLQLGNALQGHTGGVTSVAFSPDDKKIVSGSNDSTICLWDAETGLQLGSPLKGHTDRVNSVAFSPDGKMLASGSDDNTICLWDAETGLQLGVPLKGHTDFVMSVAFSPDRKKIASGSRDNSICLWDAQTGLQLGSPLKKHTDIVASVAFSLDGKRIASGSWDKTVCFWDAETGLQLGSPLQEHTSPITSVAFSPDGKNIASTSWDKTICLWDVETGLQLGSPLQGHTDDVNSAVFSPDEKRIASDSKDCSISCNGLIDS